MSTKVEIQFTIDYVCALAETLYCGQCKNLPKKAHHCINCLSPFCYICIRTIDSCPTCHVRYSDKSYLKYYELGDSNVELIISIVSRLQKENVKLPLALKKIVAQTLKSTKTRLEVGQSSKQNECLVENDEYMMHIENDPNLINNAVSDFVVDSEHDDNISTEDTNSDPAWLPDDSPNPFARKKTQRNKSYAKKAQTMETNTVKLDAKTICCSLEEPEKNLFDSNFVVKRIDKMLGTKDMNEEEEVEKTQTSSRNKVQECALTEKKKLHERKHLKGMDTKSAGSKIDGSKELSKYSAFDRLLQECAEEKSLKNSNTDKSNSDIEADTMKSKRVEVEQKNTNPKSQDEYFDELEKIIEKEEHSTSRTYGRKNNMHGIDRLKKVTAMFNNSLKMGSDPVGGTTFEVFVKKDEGSTKNMENILNKYSVLELSKEEDEPIKRFKSIKRKGKIPENNSDNEELAEVFKSPIAEDTKSSKARRIKTNKNNHDTSVENMYESNSKPIIKIRKEQTKRNRNQLGLNRNSTEIENLIRSKKLKLDDIENENSNKEEVAGILEKDEDKLNREVIEKLLNDDKEVNIGSRSTRQTKDSKNEEVMDISHELKKKQIRKGRNKTFSESSEDLSILNKEDVSTAAKSKRTRGTSRDSTNNHKSANTPVVTNEENSESVIEHHSDTTTKANLRKRALKTAPSTAETKAAKINEPNKSDGTPADSTPKTRGRRVVKRAAYMEEKSNSSGSQTTGEYLTPMSQTPDRTPTRQQAGPKNDSVDEMATPKTSLRKKEPVFKTPAMLNVTPTVTTPVTVKKTKPDPLYKRNMKGETPLHSACKRDAYTVQDLLKKQVTPNVKDNAGWTPLHDAVSIGKEMVVRLLLENGALVNVPGLENDTPLHLAVRHESVDIAKLLIQYGADIGLRNLHGYKPLEYFDFIARPDWKAQVLEAFKLPLLRPQPAPLPPTTSDLVLYGDGLDKDQMRLLAQFAKIKDEERSIVVSTLLQSNVNMVVVSGTPDRLCTPSSNVLKAILTCLKVVDVSWITACLEANRLVPSEEYAILGTTEFPEARPFQRSLENNQKMNPGLFSGLQVYLAPKPWPPASPLSYDEARDLVKCGGASLLTREPDPEAPQDAESARVMWHVTTPEHPLYRLGQGILYCNQARPRRLYNMAHVKALSVEWFRACVQTFSIQGDTQQ